MAIHDPLPGDGSYLPDGGQGSDERASADAPVPGALTPTRSQADRKAIARADSDDEVIDPQAALDRRRYPTVRRLTAGLAEDHFDDEFEAGLRHMLDQIQESIS
jgi:hypothetical protein